MMAPQWVAAADLYPLSQAIADAEPRKPQLLKTILDMSWNLYQYQIVSYASYITYHISYTIWLFNIAMENPLFLWRFEWENHL